MQAYGAALISVSAALSQTPCTMQLMLQDHSYKADTSCGLPVYAPALGGTKLYCQVTGTCGCEQLAQSVSCTYKTQTISCTVINIIV